MNAWATSFPWRYSPHCGWTALFFSHLSCAAIWHWMALCLCFFFLSLDISQPWISAIVLVWKLEEITTLYIAPRTFRYFGVASCLSAISRIGWLRIGQVFLPHMYNLIHYSTSFGLPGTFLYCSLGNIRPDRSLLGVLMFWFAFPTWLGSSRSTSNECRSLSLT